MGAKRITLTLTGALLVLGCAAVPPPRPRLATFEEAGYAPFNQDGTGVIDGQAFLKTRDGTVMYGADCPVYVDPVTSYSMEWWNMTVLQGVPLQPADSRSKRWEARADADGKFRFDGLPPGEYYVACPITWECIARDPATDEAAESTEMAGDFAFALVTVRDGETTSAVLTR